MRDFWCNTQSQEETFLKRCSPSRNRGRANTVVVEPNKSIVARRGDKAGSQDLGDVHH